MCGGRKHGEDGMRGSDKNENGSVVYDGMAWYTLIGDFPAAGGYDVVRLRLSAPADKRAGCLAAWRKGGCPLVPLPV